MIKYHIDTIPLWDTMHLNCDCPICALKRHVELYEVDRTLGPALMEPDTRIQFNKQGFCNKHLKMLLEGNNKLGLSLILESRMLEIKEEIDKNLKITKRPSKFALFNKESSEKDNCIEKNCYICDRVDSTTKKYIEAYILLWKDDAKFKEEIIKSKGLCIVHLKQAINLATKILSPKDAEAFLRDIKKTSLNTLNSNLEDLQKFIKSYNYSYQEKTKSQSADIIKTCINNINSWCVGQEPHPDDRNKDRGY